MIKIKFVDSIGKSDREFMEDMEEMFRVSHPFATLRQRLWKPQVDVCETADEVIVLAEVAGVALEDLHVEVSRRRFKIYGRREHGRREHGRPAREGRYHIAEIAFGAFERSFNLPTPVDTETVKAHYTDGLLTLRMKKAPLDMPHKIRIQNGGSHA